MQSAWRVQPLPYQTPIFVQMVDQTLAARLRTPAQVRKMGQCAAAFTRSTVSDLILITLRLLVHF
jgi:hypothetical protein